ncbi:hypothetical protein RHMOL_Rhmol07G0110600 [Rhododendron molle]|uniref:Uncharacterized protein n=1 Tax=Rhododendron molle TaxID=49168 RepID=A0ACC0N0V8_RHOML|nr:hypothetical protein RHMOL_Rhmol07G0110600 [Rhododendron molle]
MERGNGKRYSAPAALHVSAVYLGMSGLDCPFPKSKSFIAEMDNRIDRTTCVVQKVHYSTPGSWDERQPDSDGVRESTSEKVFLKGLEHGAVMNVLCPKITCQGVHHLCYKGHVWNPLNGQEICDFFFL